MVGAQQTSATVITFYYDCYHRHYRYRPFLSPLLYVVGRPGFELQVCWFIAV